MDSMSDVKTYIQSLFAQKGISIAGNRQELFEAFVQDEGNSSAVRQIQQNQQNLMTRWQKDVRVRDITEQSVFIPNAVVGKAYSATIDTGLLGWADVTGLWIDGLEQLGLDFDSVTRTMAGTPQQSGDIKLTLRFELEMAPGEQFTRLLMLIVNPDPRSLWKNIPSDPSAPYWKPDEVAEAGVLAGKQIVAASVRGRSHANTGGFRDDHYAFRDLPEAGWGIIAVSDGAGSAALSRQGAKLACDTVIEYFAETISTATFAGLDQQLSQPGGAASIDGTLQAELCKIIAQGIQVVHQRLSEFAGTEQCSLKDLHNTLAVALVHKHETGYALLSFGVGDSPIVLVRQDGSVTPMNRLDVGEFGGGTRFVTMTEIFAGEQFYQRVGLALVPDFAYLVLMTDGIYDPKFEVEANLAKAEKWQTFLADLAGENAEATAVQLEAGNPDMAAQLLQWMQFWSTGNHDDRTLVIVF
jgi:serine/threonine protein phosphatase PrpC